MKICRISKSARCGFSLVEALITISLLAILSAIVVSSYTDASNQSHAVIARQQVAAVKSALDSYVNAQLSRVVLAEDEVIDKGASYNTTTISQLRSSYNAEGMDTASRWNLIVSYIAKESLDSEFTPGRFKIDPATGYLVSASLVADKKVIELPAWVSGRSTYPTVKFFDPTA